MAGIKIQDWNNGRSGIEVHKPGCRDIVKKRDTTTYEVNDLRELVFFTYPPDDFQYDEADWQNYLSEFDMMPCCPNIPMPTDEDAVEAPVPATPAPGTHHSHKACGHELTPVARAECRATHTWNGTTWVANA
jgi:hypothetical protein